MLYVVTGVRGAGKTTLIERIKREKIALILQPSTTRPVRFEGEDEYDFVSTWHDDKYAWSIDVGHYKYGMRKSEIEKARDVPAFTVFEPTAIDTLYRFRDRSDVPIYTIGLDTVESLQEQHSRVSGDQSRLMSEDQYNLARQKVIGVNLVLKGNVDEVFSKIVSIVASN